MKSKQVNTPIISIENVTKHYFLGEEKVVAVEDIDLVIYPKEYIGILGPSGCGKSTLMHLIGLLETPTTGKVVLDGQDISKLTDKELSHLRNHYIGFVFQSFNLINKFTVLENILLPTRYAKTKLDFNPADRANELLNKFGILHRQKFFPNKISGGEQQRTAIARALIMNPQIVLADEPTGNLDTKTGNEILKLMESLNSDLGTTVIMVTHEPGVVKRTRRQIIMQDGKIIKE